MSIPLTFGLMVFALLAELHAQQPAKEQPASRFRAVDIYLNSHKTPLAAYQVEFSVTNKAAKIVGIEGGEHPAFREPPFYDPKAMQHERVIIAAFSTAPPDQLPVGKTRVASIHLLTTGAAKPGFSLKLHTAANADGKKIRAEATLGETKR